jgi:hypothetical protein
MEDITDSFTWIWTASKEFSAKLAYLAFYEGRTLREWHDPIWKCKVCSNSNFLREKWHATHAGRENASPWID